MSRLLFDEKINNLNGIFAVVDSLVEELYGGRFCFKRKLVLKASEKDKSLGSVRKICNFLLKNGANRNSKIAAIGGGVILDMTGFAAAIYMRGIKWDAVPTTLLAQADSAVGGKTGVNFGAKNILGAFHSPENVIFIDEFLHSLNKDMLLSGIGEIVKTSFLDKEIREFIAENRAALRNGDIPTLSKAAKLCALKKAEVCKEDFLDTGMRNSLNIGHTIGHAIESCTGLSHGESVLWGLKAECELFADEIDKAFLADILSTIEYYLQGRIFPSSDTKKLFQKMKNDKKNDGGIAFVIPTDIGVTRKITLETEEAKRRLYDYFTR